MYGHTGEQFCTATLTGRREMITAASCYFGKVSDNINGWMCSNDDIGCTKVAIGTGHLETENHDFDKAAIYYNVVDVHIHETYLSSDSVEGVDIITHDIAILTLEKDVTFNDLVNVANLARANHYLSQNGTIIGWGEEVYNDDSDSSSRNSVNYGNVTILNDEKCNEWYSDANISYMVPSDNLCSLSEIEGSAPCDV